MRDYIFFKNCYPQKLPRKHRLRVSQLWRKFSLEVNIRSESEKIANFSLLKNKLHKLFPRTSIAVLPTLKKVFRHCPQNFKNYPKILEFSRLRFGNVDLYVFHWTSRKFFDNPAKNFLQKHRFFLSKSKKDERQIVQQSFLTFFPSTLRLLFQHTWLLFLPKSEKTHWKSKRDGNSEKYFNHFFLKVLLRTREMQFSNLPKFFAQIWQLSLRDQKRSNNNASLQKSSKTFRCTRRLQFWAIWQKIHAKNSIISLNDQKPWAKFLHSKEMS